MVKSISEINKKTIEIKIIIINNIIINLGEMYMKTLGNIIWIIFGGLEWALALLLSGITLCFTIIGIPLGIQLFKMAGFVIWPFGRKLILKPIGGFKLFLNLLWAVLFGWVFALGFVLTGLIFCLTIIGIPFGSQYFKLASFIIMPLGKDFE